MALLLPAEIFKLLYIKLLLYHLLKHNSMSLPSFMLLVEVKVMACIISADGAPFFHCGLTIQLLPKEEKYAPPFNIRILDKRSFGREPMVGVHIIKSLDDFHVDPSPGASIKKREYFY